MSILIQVDGLEKSQSVLAALPDEIRRAVQSAIYRQAVATREAQIERAAAATGIARAALLARCPISVAPAPDGFAAMRIQASTSGIPVPEYRHRPVPVGSHPTRARISIDWPGGTRAASGFINPLGARRYPLTTRRAGHRPVGTALGPSAAALLRAVDNPALQQQTAAQLMERTADQIAAVL